MGNGFDFTLSPVEYLHFGNFLLKIAKTSKDSIEGKYASRYQEYLYKNAVMFLDKLGITEADIEGVKYYED